MGRVIKRYCPNSQCPSHRRNRKGGEPRGRYVGSSQEDGYSRHYCPECRTWYGWSGRLLVEVTTLRTEMYVEAVD